VAVKYAMPQASGRSKLTVSSCSMTVWAKQGPISEIPSRMAHNAFCIRFNLYSWRPRFELRNSDDHVLRSDLICNKDYPPIGAFVKQTPKTTDTYG
jgi:hypothetical protein